jgi:uncharacterized protein (DUF2141 family)
MAPLYLYQYNSASITLIFKNLRKTTGYIQGAIYSSSEGWPDNARKAFSSFVIDLEKHASPGSQDFTYIFQRSLQEGSAYAISCFHDENRNKTLDMNWLGIPKEGYGFSNYNLAIRVPTFEECKFIVSEKNQGIKINFKYISLL